MRIEVSGIDTKFCPLDKFEQATGLTPKSGVTVSRVHFEVQLTGGLTFLCQALRCLCYCVKFKCFC